MCHLLMSETIAKWRFPNFGWFLFFWGRGKFPWGIFWGGFSLGVLFWRGHGVFLRGFFRVFFPGDGEFPSTFYSNSFFQGCSILNAEGIFENFSKCLGKHWCRSLPYKKGTSWRSATLFIKKETPVQLLLCGSRETSLEDQFRRTTANCFFYYHEGSK